MMAQPARRATLLRRLARGSPSDAVFRFVTGGFAAVLLFALVFVVLTLMQRAWPAIVEFGPSFLWSRSWDPPNQSFGAGPYLYGTLVSSLLALAIAIPIAVGTAVALTELLPRALATPLGFLVELLAAVPSIVYGIWGFVFIVPRIRDLAPDQTFGPSLLAAGIVLAIMMLPIVTAVTRDMLLAVPRHQRDAALALGATRWEVTSRVVVPHARAGILAAAILGLGRAVGETMAVIMVIGNQPIFPTSLYEPGSTMASVIANEFGDPSGPLHSAALVELGLVLLALSLILNLAARLVVRLVTRRMRGA